MGHYIVRKSNGLSLPVVGKAQALIEDGARITHPEFQPHLICVVENPGAFDAALYCETEADFARTLNKADTRKKTYLVHDKAASMLQLQM